MKKALMLCLLLCMAAWLPAQNVETDSLKRRLAVNTNDTMQVYLLESLSYAYLSSYPDTALQYALEGLDYAREIGFVKGEAICTNALGNVYFNTGDNAKALELFLEYLRLKEKIKDYNNMGVAYFNIAGVYTESGDYRHALNYVFKAMAEDIRAKDSAAILYDLYSIGSNYIRMGKNDSALYYLNQSYALVKKLDDRNMIGAVLNTFGENYLGMKDLKLAGDFYRESLPHALEINDFEVVTANFYGLAKIFHLQNNPDSAIYYGRKAFRIAQDAPFYKQALETSSFLSGVFKSEMAYDSAFHYQELSIAIKDSLFNQAQVKKVQELKFGEQQRQQQMLTERLKHLSTLRLLAVIASSVIFFTIALLLWRNNKQKQKANLLLTGEKEKVEKALKELKSTQAQLIQSEKMASLGALTAGIAHEIQNPLNFVNNFADMNIELIDELHVEREKPVQEKNAALEAELMRDITGNLEKIMFHGKRAEAIVKGMLLHSRTSTGQKEPTELNELCDEYLRLSYHGLRASDKSFNAEFRTDFDKSIGSVNIVPQDIGRVLLNLFNNAFYAVRARASDKVEGYHPLVTVHTRKLPGKIEIRVTDNGMGIEEKILDKIFLPFFTTKPTGEGTGLGLSLSYDIVKANGGEISVQSTPGEGSVFIIHL